jgi:hypothetical protein
MLVHPRLTDTTTCSRRKRRFCDPFPRRGHPALRRSVPALAQRGPVEESASHRPCVVVQRLRNLANADGECEEIGRTRAGRRIGRDTCGEIRVLTTSPTPNVRSPSHRGPKALHQQIPLTNSRVEVFNFTSTLSMSSTFVPLNRSTPETLRPMLRRILRRFRVRDWRPCDSKFLLEPH